MELNKNHRQFLLNKLEEVQNKIYTIEQILEKKGDKMDEIVRDAYDMDLFTHKEAERLIKQSLIDNEIDY